MVTAEYRFRLECEDAGEVRVGEHVVITKNFNPIN